MYKASSRDSFLSGGRILEEGFEMTSHQQFKDGFLSHLAKLPPRIELFYRVFMLEQQYGVQWP
jgi:hypothetical protein